MTESLLPEKLQGLEINNLEVDGEPQALTPLPEGRKPRLPRNVIVCRVWSREGYFYFRMADGSLLKPETAIKRGLITRAAYEASVKEAFSAQTH